MKQKIPNILTMARIVIIPFFVLTYFIPDPQWYVYAFFLFVAACVTDWLDGYLARRWKVISTFGKFWDPIADKLLVLAALLLLVVWETVQLSWVVALILLAREFLVSGVRLVAASKGVVIAADKLGKYKTVFQMIGILVVLQNGMLFPGANGVDVTAGILLIYISAVLSVISLIQYFVRNKEVFTD